MATTFSVQTGNAGFWGSWFSTNQFYRFGVGAAKIVNQYVGATIQQRKRGFFKLSNGSIPLGSVISSATFTVYDQYNTNARTASTALLKIRAGTGTSLPPNNGLPVWDPAGYVTGTVQTPVTPGRTAPWPGAPAGTAHNIDVTALIKTLVGDTGNGSTVDYTSTPIVLYASIDDGIFAGAEVTDVLIDASPAPKLVVTFAAGGAAGGGGGRLRIKADGKLTVNPGGRVVIK